MFPLLPLPGIGRPRLLSMLVLSLMFLESSAARAQPVPWTEVTPKPPSAEALKWLPPPQDASLLTPVFLLQRDHYAVGDPILVRLGFKNMSSHVIDIRSGALPWQESKLTITGPAGQPVARGLLEIGGGNGSGRLFSISPGATGVHRVGQPGGVSARSLELSPDQPRVYRIVVQALASGANTTNVYRREPRRSPSLSIRNESRPGALAEDPRAWAPRGL
jgi:hypothetical protein